MLHSDISYHGKLLGSGSITASGEIGFRYPEIAHAGFEYNNLDSVRQALERLTGADGQSDCYALIIEPFSASTLTACDEAFLRGVAELCRERDVLLIFDEVFSGWGKTGTLFHFMRHAELLPDLLVTSKIARWRQGVDRRICRA